MKLSLVSVLASIVFLSIPLFTRPAVAVCSRSFTDSCSKDQVPRLYDLEFRTGPAGENFSSIDPQCTHPVAASGTTVRVCCDTQSEANSFFSVRAPLCGSSVELGANNSTCQTCDHGGLRCSGLSFALGQKPDGSPDTDPDLVSGVNRQAVDSGDTSGLWRVKREAYAGKKTIRYNGIDYPIPSDLIICNSNNFACGASNTTCHGLYPESTQLQAQAPVGELKVPGETNFVRIPVSTVSKIAYNLLQNTHLLNFYLSGKAEVALHEKKFLNPSLKNVRNAIFNATSFALKPLMLQQKTINASNCQRYQVAGRICVYQNGTLINTEEKNQPKSKEIYNSGDCNPESLDQGFQGGRQLAAISTKYTQLNQDYNTPYTPLAIDEEKPLLCQERDEGVPLQTANHPGPGANVFNFPGANQILGLVSQFQEIAGNLAEVPYDIVYQGTILDPHEANLWCQGSGCDDPAIQRVKYPIDPAVVKGGASFASFEPYMHDFNKFALHGGDEKQQFDTEFSPQVIKEAQTAFSYANRILQGSNYVFCTISPLGNDGTHLGLFTKRECDQDWSRENAPPPPQPPPVSNIALGNNVSTNGTAPTLGRTGLGISARNPAGAIQNSHMQNIVVDTANAAGIPVCVLEGVTMIEGGYNWGASDDNPAQCTPNRCGAAGPFQITVGHNGNNSDCAASCPEAGYCPNAWGNSSGDPCDIESAAQFAANKLKNDPQLFDSLSPLSANYGDNTEAQIRSAAYHYYGSHAPQSSLPYNGKNLSYEEFVLEHCRIFPNGETVKTPNQP